MTQIQFNVNFDELKDALINSNLEATIKSTIVLILNEYMEKERDEYLKAAAYERTTERIDYRNGYYERELLMSLGKIKLRVPRTRFGDFSPSIFEKYARCDQALVLSMLEMFVSGVSTRKVSKIVETLCGETVSRSFVSSLTSKLDPIVNKWAQRPLNTMMFEYVFVDAMYIKVREYNKVVSKAVYIATALDSEGYRHVLGLQVSHAESESGWREFFSSLKKRGLSSPKLVISDAHRGLVNAIKKEFVGTSWQRCNVHFKRNIVERLPKKNRQEPVKLLKQIFEASTVEEARSLKDEFLNKYMENSKFTKACEILDEGFDDTIQYMQVNAKPGFWSHIRSTNSLERLNQEIRRRERVIRIFPNSQSAFRLIGAILMDYEEKLRKAHRRYKI